MTRIIISLLISISITISIASARLLNVPDDYETIQAGIDAAEDGDTVLVQPGEYQENISTANKANIIIGSLILTSEDPDFISRTIVDGGGNDAVIKLTNMQRNAHVLLRGLKLRNGNYDWGGGIEASGATNAELVDLEVTENAGNYAIAAFSISDVSFRNVKSFGNRGVGVYTSASAASFENCQFSANDGNGGSLGAGTLSIRNSSFSNNTNTGLKIWVTRTITLDHLTIAGTRMLDNQAGDGLSIYQQSGSNFTAVLTNSIIHSNEGSAIVLREGPNNSVGILTVGYSDIEDGRDQIVIGEGGEPEIIWLDGNIDSDPLFVDPDNGDYHLTVDSPCIDAGDPESPEDPDGTRADMGAFYFQRNRAPEAIRQLDDLAIDEDGAYLAIADLDTVFSDPDGDTLRYSVEGSDQLNLTIDEEGVLGLEPALNFFGDSLNVQVFAFDNEDTTSLDFIVTVNPVNDAPLPFHLIAPSDSLVAPYDTLLTFVWEQTTDVEGDPLTYFLSFQNNLMDFSLFKLGDTTMTIAADSIFQLGQEIIWWVAAYDSLHQHLTGSIEKFKLVAQLSVSDPKFSVTNFQLFSAFPNPFNATTTIRFSTGPMNREATSLRVYGIDGRLVADLSSSVASPQATGGKITHPAAEGGATESSVVWNAEGLPGGIYFVRLEAGNEVRTIKTLLLK